MSFDVEAGRAVIREAESAIFNGSGELDAMRPVVGALSDALDEVTRLTNTLHAVHMALGCTHEHLREPYAGTKPPDLSEAKAMAGYGELFRRVLTFTGAPRARWEQLDAEARADWIQKVKRVEADPDRWLRSIDPARVEFARGVLGYSDNQTIPPKIPPR